MSMNFNGFELISMDFTHVVVFLVVLCVVVVCSTVVKFWLDGTKLKVSY